MAKKKPSTEPTPTTQSPHLPPVPPVSDAPEATPALREESDSEPTGKRSPKIVPRLEPAAPPAADTTNGDSTSRTYGSLLVKRTVVDAVIGQMQQTKPGDLIDGVLSPRLQTLLKTVLQHEKSRAYYYRLAFSVAYRTYELHLHKEFIETNNIDVRTYQGRLPKVKVPDFGAAIGVSRFNMPRLFIGKGQNEVLLTAIHNLRFLHISFEAILHTPIIIEKAYIHHTLLQSGVNLDDHQDSDNSLLI